MQTWHPHSWQNKPLLKPIEYRNSAELDTVCTQLSLSEPLVTQEAIDTLHKRLENVCLNDGFIFQAGECAETFEDCQQDLIFKKLTLLHQLAEQIEKQVTGSVIRIGRLAGQYAKPRTQSSQAQLGVTHHSYHGDLINQPAFSKNARLPDPKRLLIGYNCAQKTIQYCHHYADLHPDKAHTYTSHEAFLLPFEAALTHKQPNQKWYNLSAHFLWIGMRTAQIDCAHIEYARGITNPIGLKVGPTLSPKALSNLLQVLNPMKRPGRISLITRLGCQLVETRLPPLIKACRHHPVIWICDPMHGNTKRTQNEIKFRVVSDLIEEIQRTRNVLERFDQRLQGLHCELTPEKVMECVNDYPESVALTVKPLVDPRLNAHQAHKIITALKNENVSS